jgi:hypothetical protein
MACDVNLLLVEHTRIHPAHSLVQRVEKTQVDVDVLEEHMIL